MLAYGGVVREAVLVGQDALVRGLDVLGLKRRLADEEGVEDDSCAPDVHLE